MFEVLGSALPARRVRAPRCKCQMLRRDPACSSTLTLSTAPVLTQGRKGSNRLTWKRITSTPAGS